MPSKGLSRRDLLKIGAAAGAAELAAALLPGCGAPKIAASTVTPRTACSTLTAIEHVVIFIQENRSFDHYFGSYRGVRGFSDQSAAFVSPTLQTPRVHRPAYCCHSISIHCGRTQRALTTSPMTG